MLADGPSRPGRRGSSVLPSKATTAKKKKKNPTPRKNSAATRPCRRTPPKPSQEKQQTGTPKHGRSSAVFFFFFFFLKRALLKPCSYDGGKSFLRRFGFSPPLPCVSQALSPATHAWASDPITTYPPHPRLAAPCPSLIQAHTLLHFFPFFFLQYRLRAALSQVLALSKRPK